MEKQFSTFRLSFVRDMFLFSCFTGLSYADVQKLNRKDIVSMHGMNWIVIPRTKTKVEATIPILPQAQEILNRYSNPTGVTTTNKLIAVRSNQKANEYLKEIADLCEIPFNLTFHTARHTFATTITLLHDIPITLVAKMLGHKKLNQTAHYAIVQQMQIAKQMKALPEKLKQSFSGRYEES
jgi:integrase